MKETDKNRQYNLSLQKQVEKSLGVQYITFKNLQLDYKNFIYNSVKATCKYFMTWV